MSHCRFEIRHKFRGHTPINFLSRHQKSLKLPADMTIPPSLKLASFRAGCKPSLAPKFTNIRGETEVINDFTLPNTVRKQGYQSKNSTYYQNITGQRPRTGALRLASNPNYLAFGVALG